ncbi:hypothetical protein [uncultured Desulfosarcina sp.]|uniref:hypothetical protein n=1 Tax=uncultured Desulfosarcina sp. TaxID=218289 RepID=UPI0029C86225|nr:hypothetical protein [uncultured Desulfosarcina sp.]
MEPASLEAVRSGISTVGVALTPGPPETDVLLPAKGVWGGIKRGIVFGAAMPVMLGFASPVPGGTYIGLLVSPLGAVAGGIHGVSTAVPTEEVERAEAMLEIATDNLRQMGLREEFVNSLIDMGNERTTVRFVLWPETPMTPPAETLAKHPDPKVDDIDARLEISVEETGLRGIYSINPPMDTFIRVRVQLIRSNDNVILMDEHFICASDEERTFADWADHEGSDLVDEFRTCVPELAEKIIDDFFLVYPLEWNHGNPE